MFGGLWVGGCISATTIGQIPGFFCAIWSVHSTPTTEKIPRFLHLAMATYTCLTLICMWNTIKNGKQSVTDWNRTDTRCFPEWDTGISNTIGVSKYMIGPMHMIVLPTMAFFAVETPILRLLHPFSMAGTLRVLATCLLPPIARKQSALPTPPNTARPATWGEVLPSSRGWLHWGLPRHVHSPEGPSCLHRS